VQAGLDQLYKEIKDNPKALAAFEKMRNLLAEGINSDVEEAPYTKQPKVVGSGRKSKTKGGKA
jgi:tRNA nucleotidyltransferase (CCA-adding enzyme)